MPRVTIKYTQSEIAKLISDDLVKQGLHTNRSEGQFIIEEGQYDKRIVTFQIEADINKKDNPRGT